MNTKGQRTRAHIVDQVLPLLNTHGYAGTSLESILAATGLRKGGVYNHFGSKEDLALAAFDAYVVRFRERLSAAVATAPDAHACLTAIAAQLLRIASDPVTPGGCLVFNTALDADDSQPNLAARAHEALRDLLRFVALHVRRGIRSGELRADVDPRQTAVVLVSVCEGAIAIGRLFDDPDQVKRAAAFVENYLDQLRRPGSQHGHSN